MIYNYKAYIEDNPDPIDQDWVNDGRKIKDLITINITIEMEKEKYEAKKKKYKEPISKKILKLFK